MSHTAQTPSQAQGIPRAVLGGAGALIAFAISATLFARAYGMGDVHMPATEAYQVLRLDFDDVSDG